MISGKRVSYLNSEIFWCPTKINLLMKNEFETKLKKKCSLQNIRLAINTTVGKIRLAQLARYLNWKFKFPNLASINGLTSSFFNELTFTSEDFLEPWSRANAFYFIGILLCDLWIKFWSDKIDDDPQMNFWTTNNYRVYSIDNGLSEPSKSKRYDECDNSWYFTISHCGAYVLVGYYRH